MSYYLIDSPNYALYYIYDGSGLELATISKTEPDFSVLPNDIIESFQNNTMVRVDEYEKAKLYFNDTIALKFFGTSSSTKKYVMICGVVIILLFIIGRK